jgi:glycosyltransferase involved in cell wall biosynthesis
MKVCFVVPNAYSLFYKGDKYPFGGSEIRAYTFAKKMSEDSGLQISFAVFNYGQQSVQMFDKIKVYAFPFGRKSENESETFFSKIRFRLNNIYNTIKPRPKQLEQLKELFQEIDADRYLFFGVSEGNYRYSRLIRELDKRHVLLLGSDNDLSEKYSENASGFNVYGSRSDSCWKLINESERIICQSHFQQQELLSRFSKRSVVIKNPIDLTLTSGEANYTYKKPFALWVGKSNDVKRPEVFVELAKRSENRHFVMVMNRSNAAKHQSIINDLPANIMYIEKLQYEEVEKYFANAAFTINTSVFEGMPNTFLQAGKYSIPVLSMTVDPDKILTENNGGVVAENNIDRLFERSEELFSNNEYRTLLGKNLRQYVEHHHEINKVSKELREFLTL